MRLTAIHLHGFKSFPERTVFPVDAPLTAILGPNGCGKSNIIDAVRWVLGESAAKQLRGQAMSDVIFAGCQSRAPSRQASVELHFDNSDQQAGGAFADFAELVIRREIDSEGQSRYLINKKRCRRRDIIDLLQGSGVGARSYAVIEQGMISRVIEAKPEELRSFIEEASGIAVYQSRRKESERRMARVNEHLTRHDDRLYDLTRQRSRLEQEAEIAQQYREIQRQISDQQHRLNSWQYHRLQIQQATLNKESTEYETQLIEMMAVLNREQTQLPEVVQQAEDALNTKRQAAANWRKAQQHEQLINQQQLSQNQALRHTSAQLNQLNERQARLDKQNAADGAQLRTMQEEVQQVERAQQNYDASYHQQQADYQNKEQTYHAQQAAYDTFTKQRAQRDAERAQAQSTFDQATNRLEALDQRIAERTQEQQAHEDHALAVEEAALAQETQALAVEDAEVELARIEANLQTTEAALNTAQQDEQAARDAFQHANHQYQTLQQWGEEAQEVPSSEAPLLLDALRVDPLWRTALERFLGKRLQAVYQAKGNHQNALAQQQALVSAGDVPLPWQEIVQSEAALSDWLADVWPLAEHDVDIDLKLLDKNKHYLTLDGTLITAHSIVPLRDGDQSGALARSAQRRTLAEELPALEAAWQDKIRAHEQAKINHQRLKIEITQAQQALASQREAHQQSANTLIIKRNAQQYAERLAAEQRAVLHSWQQERESTQQALNQAQAQLNTLPDDADDSAVDEQALTRVRDEWHSARQALNQLSQEKQTNETRLTTLRAHIQAYIEREARNEAEQDEIKVQQQYLTSEQETLSLALETLEEELIAANESLLEAETGMQDAEVREHEATQNVQRLERTLDRRQHEIDLAQHQMAQYQDRSATIDESIAQLQAHFLDSDRKAIIFPEDMTLDERSLQRSLKSSQRALTELGAVNLSAIETFRSVDEEYQTLNQQCEDLRQSLDQLNEAIRELDEETRQRLHETMGVINHHFAALFPRLFRGGEAALEWSEDDVLSAGVNIRVRPPGKTIKNLSALSGGEKALTAIALVFALFRLNPAPFCLLDEVDAPLDDGNVGRLTALLRDMAQHTQFVVITHHKTTMQACDHLIGVTMSEPGISRLVAVSFDEAQ
ncbi:chromosome segregation protein SMC [Suttonella sp. R2A3]|uniref:chromosome segregation protein SMC n=1 Tax=Suttonella sp. R2A3 TaxID=2908648 RepID=UPI001F475CD4|nr:chromosome segregation protein SMC [Suttonella sp. R2A3]UJF25028.1 chromosome segregation protein SMC [Suttonella sp. R2A3]